jgi:methylase of polypeptide subunit release factors
VNPLHIDENSFDVIVGNPPYMATEHMKQFTPAELPVYKKKYQSAYKQFDKYFLFVERAMQLLKRAAIWAIFSRPNSAKSAREKPA